MSDKLSGLIEKYTLDKKVKEHLEVDGDFTICLLEKNKVKAIGVAKRNVRLDVYDLNRGHAIAFARAVKKLDAKLNPPLILVSPKKAHK